LAAAACASAQVTLSTVQNGVATPAGQVVPFGSVAAGWDVSDIVFNVSYTGTASPYYLTYFNLQQGTSFSVLTTDWPSLPWAIPAGGLNFTVRFQPNQVSQSYGAKLEVGDAANPITVILAGQGIAGFTVAVANQPLSIGAPITFGSVQIGSSQTLTMTLTNPPPPPGQTGESLVVGAIAFQGAAFQLAGASPVGAVVPSGSSAELQLVFNPTAVGTQQGTLTIGVASFPLQGTGAAPPPPAFPAPSIQVDLATPASAQQGSISVSLSSGSAASGSGTVTLAFQSAVTGASDDPTIAFTLADGSSSASATFSVAEGASEGQFAGGPSLLFETGTTAGTLVFTATLGAQTAQTTVTIPAALVKVDAAVAVRNAACDPALVYCTTANVQLQVNGWDNTRSASQLVFSFFDSSGNAIAPGNITATEVYFNGLELPTATAFQQYFAGSDMAGVFGLSAFFPVNGDSSQVVAAVVEITNSAGIAQSTKITF